MYVDFRRYIWARPTLPITLGGIVEDKLQNGSSRYFGFSAAHGLAIYASNTNKPLVYQMDSNQQPFAIGRVYSWLKLNPADTGIRNGCDVALFEFRYRPPNLQPPNLPWNGFAQPEIGQRVKMLGAFSGLQAGIVDSFQASPLTAQHSEGKSFIYENLFAVKSTLSSPFSQPGDSGAAIVNENKKLVGLLVGRDNSHPTISYACRVSCLESLLGP